MRQFILALAAVVATGCSDTQSPADAGLTGPTGDATTLDGTTTINRDENFDCAGSFTGSFTNVFVRQGKTCRLQNAKVSGNILAEDGASLFVVRTRVDGNIDGVEARTVQVQGGSLGGSIQIQDGSSPGQIGASVTGGTVLSQGNITIQKLTTGTIRITDAVLHKGNIQVQENVIGSSLDLRRNRVAQNLQVFVNSGSAAKVVQGNRVSQTLECKENTLPFTGGPNQAGEAKEQCF